MGAGWRPAALITPTTSAIYLCSSASPYSGHTDMVFAAEFHPGGKRLASTGRDRVIWLWDLATCQEVARLEGHTNYVFSLAFRPDGASLVSGSGDGTV